MKFPRKRPASQKLRSSARFNCSNRRKFAQFRQVSLKWTCTAAIYVWQHAAVTRHARFNACSWPVARFRFRSRRTPEGKQSARSGSCASDCTALHCTARDGHWRALSCPNRNCRLTRRASVLATPQIAAHPFPTALATNGLMECNAMQWNALGNLLHSAANPLI